MSIFACPTCQRQLRLAANVPADTSVKCPGCQQVFRLSAETGDGTAVQRERPAPLPMATPPRSSSSRYRPDRDDDYEDDNDDLDRRIRREPRSGSKTGLVLAFGGIALLVLFIVTGFIWPGFLSAVDNTPALDPYTFLPADCDVIFGANKPGQVQLIERLMRKARNVSARDIDTLKNVDRIVAGMAVAQGEAVTMAATGTAPWDQWRLRRGENAGAEQTVNGKTFFAVTGADGKPGFMSFPNSRTLVYSTLPEAEFVKVLDAKGAVPADVQPRVNEVNQKPFWLVLRLQGALKNDMVPQPVEMAALIGNDGVRATAILSSSKVATLVAEVPKDAALRLDVDCRDDKDAADLERLANTHWPKAKLFLALMPFAMANQPGGKAIISLTTDVASSLKFQRQGARLSATAALKEATINELENLDAAALMNNAMAGQGQGFLPPPPPQFRPPPFKGKK